MRIVSGKFKGRTFSVPSGFPSRPTTDFAKEGLFNILNNQLDYDGIRVLDLCAGTGNISFEFISRGAELVTAVDKNRKVSSWITVNASKLGVTEQVKVVNMDCLGFLQKCTQQFDVIFADPPFEVSIHSQLKMAVFSRNLLREGGLMIIEHGKQTSLSEETNFVNKRTFGNVNFSFFQ